ncbi:MAG: molybdopterin dinucleotide binding domain-containing protein [Desulfobacterium sp.]
MSSNDAAIFNIGNGEMVNVFSRRGKIKAKLSISSKAVDGTIIYTISFCPGSSQSAYQCKN